MSDPFKINYPEPKRDGSNQFNFATSPKKTPENSLKIGIYNFPGICTVEVVRTRKAKIQTRKEGKGDRLIDSGLELARVNIKVEIYSMSDNYLDNSQRPASFETINYDDEFAQMADIVSFFESRVGIGPSTQEQGFAIVNPITRARGVLNVFVESISGPVNYMPPGRQEWMFSCVEVIPKKDVKPKTVNPSPDAPLVLTTPVPADFQGLLPSQDSKVLGPKPRT